MAIKGNFNIGGINYADEPGQTFGPVGMGFAPSFPQPDITSAFAPVALIEGPVDMNTGVEFIPGLPSTPVDIGSGPDGSNFSIEGPVDIREESGTTIGPVGMGYVPNQYGPIGEFEGRYPDQLYAGLLDNIANVPSNITQEMNSPQPSNVPGSSNYNPFSVSSDPTFSSGLNYARSIAGGENVQNMIAPGISYSMDTPQGYTTEGPVQQNTTGGNNVINPPMLPPPGIGIGTPPSTPPNSGYTPFNYNALQNLLNSIPNQQLFIDDLPDYILR
tara:strand:- start:4740 stop:5558 length:819 start_codon:yes stop_codon:yes gene_type:complete